MATPPFNILESKPADTDIVSQFPADERSNRDIIESAIGVEHGIGAFGAEQGGRHRFGVGSNAARDAITTWEVGSLWLNTVTSPAKLQRVVSINPDVWEDVAAQPSSTSFTTDITVTDTDPGAARGPEVFLYRNSASPAANDIMGGFVFQGEDSAGNTEEYASIDAQIVDPTSTSEDARVRVRTGIAGTTATRLNVQAGVYTEGATGGDQGAGTINATALFDDGVQAVADINALTTTDNPASSAFVAGSTGAATNRKFRVGEVGGWVPLEEQTASSSASLNFVLTNYITDFEDFEFIIHALRPATDAVFLWLRTSTDGGASYDAGAFNYAWVGYRSDQGALTGDRSTAAPQIVLTSELDSIGNTADSEAFSGRVMLYNPAAAVHTRITSHGNFSDAAGNPIDVAISGIRLAAADVDAVRFLMSSGNIASGKITMLGRRKVT